MDAEPVPLAAVHSADNVVVQDAGSAWVIRPKETTAHTGLVFVPGAKVDPLAYAAVLHPVAAAGTYVVIVKPPLRLAILDVRRPGEFTSLAPEVATWAVGGHSLGGVVACRWAQEAEFSAVVLFASYCAADLSQQSTSVLSIAASEDWLTTADKIESARHLLPASADMQVIEGASHASFGAYGPQDGDGQPTISAEHAHRAIATLVEEFLVAVQDESGT